LFEVRKFFAEISRLYLRLIDERNLKHEFTDDGNFKTVRKFIKT